MSAARKRTTQPDEVGRGLTVQRARDTLAELVLRAGFGREAIVIERRGQPTAVLIGFQEYERLKALEGAAT